MGYKAFWSTSVNRYYLLLLLKEITAEKLSAVCESESTIRGRRQSNKAKHCLMMKNAGQGIGESV